jgi:hypothetical protein
VSKPKIKILSLGAGVQSTTLLLLAAEGRIGPLDGAIFSDTGWEPAAVYAHLDRIEREVAVPAGIPIHRVSVGNIRADALNPAHRFASMPLFVKNQAGGDGMIRRQCSAEYKIRPIKSKTRELLGCPHPKPIPRGVFVETWIGFSKDEVFRLRDSDVLYMRNVFPLLELEGSADGRTGWTRSDCIRYLRRKGFGETPKSACIGCPFHGNRQWRQMRDERPEEFAVLDRQAKHLLGGAWDLWWLRTPLPGVVWCNCPHMIGFDAVKVEDMTAAELEGRRRITALVAFARAHLPGFEDCHLLDVASQLGVRQTRLLDGDYVVTKEDLAARTRFPDTVARGRDYTTPYRAMLPKNVENLLVAGRHYSATSTAQKMSREIPPCMAMGEAAGMAAALALDSGVKVRDIDVKLLQKQLRAQGADPGDQPGRNPDVPEIARHDHVLELIA